MARRKNVTSSSLRDELMKAVEEAQQERATLTAGVFGSRQEVKESNFSSDIISKNSLITPPYDPDRLYTIVESSGILPQCVDAMVQNVDGFGYELKYTGDPENEGSDAVIGERKNIGSFFDRINERESFRTLRINLRRDIEVTGNGYIEIIRFMGGGIATMYHMDSRLVRLQAKQDKPTKYRVKMWRNGKLRPITVMRRFRRYAMMVSPGSSKKLRWFKEFGDPRKMCAVTGKYEDELDKKDTIKEEASEVLHFKIGNGAYGVPRWSGQVLNALGMNSADYVNWDLFENQVVPPLVVMVSGGTLTTESVRDIKRILIRKRGVENFNKVLILEAQSEGNVTDKSAIKIEMKELSVARKEDAMFVQYTDKGEHRVRSAFRLPPLYAGRADCFSEDTQTLTEKGWRFYWEIGPDDKIATFNPKLDQIEFHTPNSGLRLFDYKGPMYHFNNTVVDIMVSPNHDMWTANRSGNKWSKVEAQNIFDDNNLRLFRVSPNNCLEDDITTVRIDAFKRRSRERILRHLPADLVLRLIGYYVADGSITKRESRYSISLSANKPRKLKLFRQLAEELSSADDYIKVSECTKADGMTKITISEIGLFDWICEKCGERTESKVLPEFCMHLSARQSRILLEALINTDGSPSGYKTWEDNPGLPSACRYNTTSIKLADQVQILGFRSGFRSNLSEYIDIRPEKAPVYMVSLKKSSTVMIQPDQLEIVDYKGKIYCFDVPNHLFVTRRNGKISIQGNTYSKSTADSSKMIAEEQVFVPERSTFDEIINITLMPEIGAVNWAYSSKGPRLITGMEVIEGFKEFSKAGVITINEGIRLANRILNMDITKYDAAWANYPIPIVIELARMGVLKDIDEISGIAGELSDYILERRSPLPEGAAPDSEHTEVDDTEVDEEVGKVYSQLIRLRSALREIADKRTKRSEEANNLLDWEEEESETKADDQEVGEAVGS